MSTGRRHRKVNRDSGGRSHFVLPSLAGRYAVDVNGVSGEGRPRRDVTCGIQKTEWHGQTCVTEVKLRPGRGEGQVRATERGGPGWPSEKSRKEKMIRVREAERKR